MRISAMRVVCGACAAVVLAGVSAGQAQAQDVLSNNDFPLAWVNPGAPNIDIAGSRVGTGNLANVTGNNLTVGTAAASVRLQIQATVTEDKNAVRDQFTYVLGENQNFAIVDAMGGNLWAPLFTKGTIAFFQNAVAPNANFAIGSITATAQFMRFDGTNYVPLNSATLAPADRLAAAKIVTATLSRDAQVNAAGGAIDQVDILRYDNAPLAQFQLQIRLTITGEADKGFLKNSDNGSGATVNANSADANDLLTGATAGLGYSPSTAKGLPDSLAVVGAPAARGTYGVDGSGSTIGMLEPGRVIDTHTAFAGGKVTQLRQRLGQQAGLTNPVDATTMVADGRSEHATGVAGIAAGKAGNGSQMGVAPGAGILSVAAAAYVDDAAGPGAKRSGQKQFDELLAGSTVINMSANYGDITTTYVDQQMAAKPLVTFVKSAGNAGIAGAGANTITNPGMSYNIITVGSVDQMMTATGAFSSTNNTGGTLRKPDVVAPGDYVVVPNAIDTNGDGTVNDFDRRFTGSDARYWDAATTDGGASGTSFAAPHVSGTIALMQDYARRNPDFFDATSIDHRVLKAVLLNGADRKTVKESGGGAWSQFTVVDTGVIKVKESLDRELGAGLLNVNGALKNYASKEIRQADDAPLRQMKIKQADNSDILSNGRTAFWDLQRVQQSETAPVVDPKPGTVDYILGSSFQINTTVETGLVTGRVMPNFQSLSAVLNWDRTTTADGTAYNDLSQLELRLYVDGLNEGNVAGYDPSDPNADKLLMTTDSSVENVKMLNIDTVFPDDWTFNTAFPSGVPQIWAPKFYLEVIDLSAGLPIDFGVSVNAVLPEPSLVWAGVVAVAVVARRRRVGS